MNRYQKITAMEPGEFAEFLDNYEDFFCGSCSSAFCEYFIEGGGCKDHPEGGLRDSDTQLAS